MRQFHVALGAAMAMGVLGCGRQQGVLRTAPSPAVATRTSTAPGAAAVKPAAPSAKPVAKPAPSTKKVAAKPAVKAPARSANSARTKPVPTLAKKTGKAYIRPPRVDSLALERALLQEHSYIPLAFVLSLRSGNQEIADRVAAAVLFEAGRANLSPSFVAAVLMVENTPMDPTAESAAGAVGLMQVMPMHSGGWGCPADLEEIEANICHGSRLLHMLLERTGNTEMALRRYNGCLGRRVTPSCLRYPRRVMRIASSIRRDMLTVPVKIYEIAEAAPPPPPAALRRASEFEIEPIADRVDTLWARLSSLTSSVTGPQAKGD